MNTNFTNFFNCAAKTSENTGGGISQRYALRSEGAQNQTNYTLHQLWRYAACLLLAFVLGIGNVWADTDLTISPLNSSTNCYFNPDATVITAITGEGGNGFSWNSGTPKVNVTGSKREATMTFTIGSGITITSFKVNGTANSKVTYDLDGTDLTIGSALTGLSKTSSMVFKLTCTETSGSTARNTTISSFDISYTSSGGGGTGTGTGTISWAITTNTQTLTPTISGAGSSKLSNASTTLSLTGLSTTSSSKSGYCKPFYGTVVDCPANDDYASVSFKVANGYTFTPSSLSLTCFSNNSGNFKYKAVISDATYTITSNELQPSSGGEGAITFASNAFTGKALTGTVTIKLFTYGLANSSSGTRSYIKSPIEISGTVAEAAPSCPAPKSLTNGTTTYNSQAVTWTKGDDESAWEVIHLAKDATAPAANATPDATVNSASYTFTGLTESTAYDWYVRAKCSDSSKSDWVKGTSFTTSAAPVANPTISSAVNEAGWGSVSDGNEGTSITVTSGSTISISSNVLTCDTKTLTATPTAASAEYTYAFSSWSGVTNGQSVTTNVTATANFTRTAVNYTLAWNKNAEDADALEGEFTSGTVAFGSAITKPNTPTREGYKFAGWAETSSGDVVEVPTTMPAANKTYFAKWNEIVCIGNEGGTLFSMAMNQVTDGTKKSLTASEEVNLGDSYATVTGGIATFTNTGTAKGKIDKATPGLINFDGNAAYLILDLECKLNIGDSIIITNTTTNEMSFTTSAEIGTDYHTETVDGKGVFVVPSELKDVKKLYCWRATSSTGLKFSKVEVIRPAKYAMTFDAGDGEGLMASVTCIEKSQVTLPACTFTAPENKEFDAWVVTKTVGGASVTVTDGKFTMPQEAVKATATWKAITPKYGVTYVLNGPTGDAPTEADKAEGDEFTLASEPSWDGHVFQGWKWTDNSSVDHVEEAEAAFTMPAYAVTFTAQWKLENDAAFSNKVAFENAEVALGSLFTSSSDGTVTYALKVASETASISGATFTATAAGSYVVVASQAATSTYVAAEKEATIEVLETEVEDIFIFKKDAGYGGDGKCLTAVQANTDDGAHQYTAIAYEGFTGMGRAKADNTECILTFSVKSAYSSALGIKSICTYGKFEEPLGGQISWDGGTNWEDLAAYTDGKKEFDAPGTFPTSFKIKFMGVSKDDGGLWWRNALVTLEKKKAITNTAIDLTAVKINNSSISAANLATLKTGPAYALGLADEYVTAPTVKFTKHTVITYEDDSEVEKDDVITETADVNLSGKWEASAEINAITYTVTMAKADAFVVHYYQADGETLIGSENVAVSGHPTAAGITPTPQDYKRVVWKLNDEPVDLEDVTSDVAGTEITLVASYETVYASSINIEQWVLDNRKNNTAFRAVLDAQGFKYSNLNDLDSLTTDKNESDRNYPFLGQKIKTTGGYISFLLKAGSELHVKFGNIPAAVNLIVNNGEPVAKSASFDYTAGGSDEVIKLATTTDGTVVFKQIMIDEAIETVVLPAIVTYDANGGSFAKTSEKYTGTPLVIADATPASEDYLFDGWHLGTVDGAAIDATGYEPTKNVTLVAKYVLKPSPFSLSALTYKIGDGAATAVGYEEGTYEYTVKLPYAHSYDAITVAATLSDGTSSLKAAISQPSDVPGDASFTVVADDESEQEYVIHFVKEAKDGLEIIGAVVTGNTTATVTGVYKGDASVKLNSKKIDNGDYYIYVTLKDGYTFEETDVLVVDVHTKSDIGTKALEITTGVGDISGDVWKTIALDDYSTGENIIALTGIAANQTSIGLKRSANINAKINGLKVLRPMNPVLKTVTVAGVEGEPVADVVTIEVPFSTSDAALSSVAIDWISNSDAWTAAHDPAVADAWAWGVENTVTLTDKDGDQSVYSVTISKAVASSDATLSALSYGDPATAIALQDGVYEYNVVLPYGTTVVPALAATKNHVGAAEPVVANASVFANRHAASTVTITAEDNSTVLVYTVNFEVSRYQEIMLWDGSTMSAVVANGNASLKGVTWEATGVSPTSFSAKTCAENSKSYTKALDFGGTTGNSRQFSITIPNGYLAKLSLVYRAKNTEERYLMISSALAGAVNENTIGSVKAQGNSSDLFVVTFDQLVAGKVYINTTEGFHVHEIRIMMTPGYARSVTSGTYGTVCVDHNVAIEDLQGVTVYELMGREPVYRKLAFDEIVSGELEAGAPYVFQANGDRMIMLYGETKVDEPVDKHNGMYGTFEQVVLTELDDVYYFAQKALWSCDGALDLTIPANRAYVKLSEIGDLSDPNPAPGRRRVTMNVNGEKIATGIDALNASEAPVKMMINGQLFILRGEKMFDATGRLVK